MPGGTHLGPKSTPTDISTFGASVIVGQTLAVLILIARYTSATIVGEFGGKKVYYSQLLFFK